MDPRATSLTLSAPSATGASTPALAPGRSGSLPAVDDRLVAPEAHAEILDGRVYRTRGSNMLHGTRHFEAAHLFAGTLAEGYLGAVDMLTRADEDSDAAPDISVFPAAPHPRTGGRQLEEIAVEVLDAERLSHATEKVEKLAARGVRRLFAIRVATRSVYEWDHAHHDWTEVAADTVLVDRCFRVPIPAFALVDRVLADDTVARALIASGNAVIGAAVELGRRDGIVEGRRDGIVEGLVEGRRASLRTIARVAGITLSAEASAAIDACADTTVLDRWIANSRTATTEAELLR